MARPRKPVIKLPPHVNAVTVKGREYFYAHPGRGTARAQKPVRLPNDPGSPDFWLAYRRAMSEPEPRHSARSVAALIEAYAASPEWLELSKGTRTNWALFHRRIETAWGRLDVAGIRPKHVPALRDRYADRPAAANNLMRALSSLLAWSVPRGWRPDNPCREVRKLKGGEAYAPWPWDAIEHFRSVARTDLWHAAALALYTGQRQSDVLDMRWPSIEAGMIRLTQRKTGKELWIPIHRDLARILSAIPRRCLHILVNSRGQPWTPGGFGVAWRDEMLRPEMQQVREARLVFHGLRKSAVVMLLEAGATEAEVQAITGQSREMVTHYSRQVNQRRLAASAILKWEAETSPAQTANESLQNSGADFAKPASENKTEPEQHHENEKETWSGRRESNPHIQLGKLTFYH
jgi:integrase